MAGKSPLQCRFRLDGYPPRASSTSKVTKRHRVPLSCGPCRTRKLKCNREQPCEECTKRGDKVSCLYVTSTDRNLAPSVESGSETRRTEHELRRLERLVADAIKLHQGNAEKPVIIDSVVHQPSANPEDLSTVASTSEGTESTAFGPTTWTAILENIQDVIAGLDADADNVPIAEDAGLPSPNNETTKISIFTAGRPSNLEAVLSELPPREEVDRYLSRYFKIKFVVLPFVHIHHFQRMYEAFWNDPLQSPICWIAQLFAILSISAVLSDLKGSKPLGEEGTPSDQNRLLTAAAQCLNLGDFTQPQRYVIEALLLYAQCKYMCSPEPVGELWVLFGVIMRQALRMGYHRDPSRLQNVTVFEGEMRRRCWAIMRQLDLLNSYQMGLPSSTQSLNSDTALPRNLEDSDFDEDSTVLPAARSPREPSHLLYFIAKGSLMTAFEEVLKYESSFEVPSDRKIATLDAQLRRSHEAIPLPFRLRSMTHSFADTSDVIVMRANMEILFQKSICILHRRNLTMRRPSVETMKSCTEASSMMLKLQVDLHQEAQPGGQLHEERWMLSSLNTSDFFLAAMILSLVLLQLRPRTSEQELASIVQPKLELLLQSLSIFDAQKTMSRQAGKIVSALKPMERKIRAIYALVPSSEGPDNEFEPVHVPPFFKDPLLPEDDSMSGTQPIDMLDDFLVSFDDFDWTSFDQYPFDTGETSRWKTHTCLSDSGSNIEFSASSMEMASAMHAASSANGKIGFVGQDPFSIE